MLPAAWSLHALHQRQPRWPCQDALRHNNPVTFPLSCLARHGNTEWLLQHTGSFQMAVGRNMLNFCWLPIRMHGLFPNGPSKARKPTGSHGHWEEEPQFRRHPTLRSQGHRTSIFVVDMLLVFWKSSVCRWVRGRNVCPPMACLVRPRPSRKSWVGVGVSALGNCSLHSLIDS